MEINFKISGQWRADAAIVFAWKNEEPEEVCGSLEGCAPWFPIAPAWRDFSGEKDELALMYGPEKMDIPRILVIGMGDTRKASASGFRDAFATAIRSIKGKAIRHIGIDLASARKAARLCGMSAESVVRELAALAGLALYRFDRYKSGEETGSSIERLSFFIDGASCPESIRRAARMGEAEAAGVCLARDLANTPANLLPPHTLAEAAEKLAQRSGISCSVLGPEELASEGMNAMLAVAAGSSEEARAAVLKCEGVSAEAPIVLVGKGLTFDSGGICLKPAAGMEEMKSDMSGAAAVLGVFEALDVLSRSGIRPKRTVIGILACAENMPGGSAVKPGDLVRAKNGKTIEIVNTDAEGRLVLADALAYGAEKFSPALMVDIATLTGACLTTLGYGSAGLFTDDDALARRILGISRDVFERTWRLPIWDDLFEGLKSTVADMANSGPKPGGSIRAAVFLKQFVPENIAWAHLDIAAADNLDTPSNPKGTSGFGVRTLLALALGE